MKETSPPGDKREGNVARGGGSLGIKIGGTLILYKGLKKKKNSGEKWTCIEKPLMP